MKKVVFASLLAFAGAATVAPAQQPAQTAGQIQMSQEEYAAYQAADQATTPAAKAAGWEAYLQKYPNSAVKNDVLNKLVLSYSQTGDATKTLDAADRLLAVDPNNMRALTIEVFYRRQQADAITDAAAKTAALDKVATYAQTGLNAPQPKDMSADDFAKLQKATKPTFESAIAADDLAKKDYADAITAIKAEIATDPEDTNKPSPVLQDVLQLGIAYYQQTPPDYLNCAWYSTRAAAFAPDQLKPTVLQTASYCYTKYHGSKDGFDQLQAKVQTSIDPPADLATTITPAPKPADIVNKLFADPTFKADTLAPGDREFVLVNGTDDQANQVWDPVKGKTAKFPGAVVVTATADKITASISEDAVQGKTADFEFDMAKPLTKVPAVGDKVTLIGTYASYTKTPTMIVMSDASIDAPAAAKKPTTTRRPVHH